MLETKRLILRQWQNTDYIEFAAMNSDASVMAFFPNTLTIRESDAFADGIREKIDKNGWGLWAIELKRSGAFIGYTGLNVPSVDLPFGPCVEVGWRIAKRYWGNGFATEAAQKALAVGFETLGLEKIVSFTSIPNRRSQSVMLNIGMKNTCLNFEHPSIPKNHPLREHVLYSIVRKDWELLGWSKRPGCANEKSSNYTG